MVGRVSTSMTSTARRARSSSAGGTRVLSGAAAPQQPAMLRLTAARQQAISCRACGAMDSQKGPPWPQAVRREGAHRYHTPHRLPFRLSRKHPRPCHRRGRLERAGACETMLSSNTCCRLGLKHKCKHIGDAVQGLHAHTPLDRRPSLLPSAGPPRRSTSFTPDFTIHAVRPHPSPSSCLDAVFLLGIHSTGASACCMSRKVSNHLCLDLGGTQTSARGEGGPLCPKTDTPR